MVEAAGLMKGPHRIFPLLFRISADAMRSRFDQRTLYSYTSTIRPTEEALGLVIDWILRAQQPDGGVPAYYSLMRGYSESYPEVTGYIVPTLYDFAHATSDSDAAHAAERATNWLLSLRMSSGAFPAGLHTGEEQPSVFNTGQILQGLVRGYMSCGRPVILGVDGQARQVVEEARGGLVIEPENANALVSAIKRLAGDANLRQQFGERGRAYIVERCSRRRTAEIYLDVLREVLSEKTSQ